MSYTINETHPPHNKSAVYWERSQDPYHGDAYKALNESAGYKETAFERFIKNVKEILNPDLKRKSGWMAIDYNENPLAFVADGTVVDYELPEFIFRKGPYTHTCAYYANKSDTAERMATHKEWMVAKAISDNQ